VFAIFLVACGTALIFNAAPGPVFAAAVRHAVRGGFRPALAVQVGALAGDAAWAILGLASVELVGRLESRRVAIGVAGAVYLLWLAYDAWRASTRDWAMPLAAATDGQHPSALRAGIVLSLTNPQNIGYWAALGSALAGLGVRNPGPDAYAVFFAGFMLTSIAWAFFFAAVVGRALGRAGPRWARIMYRLCSVLFLILAALSLKVVIR
jgi:chemosensory pili system protein ChpE/L-lysine exporter family protein LysE/ArgO